MMIRKFNDSDMDSVLTIWLAASIQAHDFIASEYWEAQLSDMRKRYIPASETFVFEYQSEVVGFYSLYENKLAAIFVLPEFQGKGIGKQLLIDAKTRRTELTLTVYKENVSSCQFYLSQGFRVVEEQIDEHTGHPEYVMGTSILEQS